jgi:hypothetical protein
LEQFQQLSFLQLHTCVHIICTVFILLLPFLGSLFGSPLFLTFHIVSPTNHVSTTCKIHPSYHYFLNYFSYYIGQTTLKIVY